MKHISDDDLFLGILQQIVKSRFVLDHFPERGLEMDDSLALCFGQSFVAFICNNAHGLL
ncbi:hypothetical protein [Gluconobacter oxydans]|uniref:hypothetical protein n=1 Tax=Gluconobacter oxydans TaxID=442 RepID=UPI0039ECDF52